MRQVLAVAVLLMFGCSEEPKSGSESTKTPATPTCEDYRKKVGPHFSDDPMGERLVDSMVQACREDKWSDEIIRCFVSRPQDECEKKLSKEQLTHKEELLQRALLGSTLRPSARPSP